MPTAQYFEQIPPFPDDVATLSLPRISLAKIEAGDLDEAARLFDECQRLGFVLLDLSSSHRGNILLGETEGVFRLSEELYQTPAEDLMNYAWGSSKSLYGYKQPGDTKLENGRPDNIAFYNIRRDDILGLYDTRAHPTPIERQRALLASWFQHTHGIVESIFGSIERHLHLAAGTLSRLNELERPSGTHARLTKSTSPSPPMTTATARPAVSTSFLGHTDVGSITVLFNAVGGLQILPPGQANADPNWRYVRPEPGCAIVNVGDALVEWSGGVLRSNMHRVVSPPGRQAACDRYSVACLVRPTMEVSMKRLDSDIIDAATAVTTDTGNGEFGTINVNAKDWEEMRIAGIIAGKGVYKSLGGRLIKTADVKVEC